MINAAACRDPVRMGAPSIGPVRVVLASCHRPPIERWFTAHIVDLDGNPFLGGAPILLKR